VCGLFSARPVQLKFKKRLGSATTLYGTVALSFVIPSEAEGSAVLRTSPGNAEYYTQTKLSSRPERSRISYHAELATSTYAPFRRERRMRLPTPTSSTGNPGERSGEICGFLLLLTQLLKPS
jgi:hypothetical protein